MTLLGGSKIQDFDLPFNILGISIHWKDDHAIIRASEHGHIDIVKFLMEKGCDIHALQDMPLRFASVNNHVDIVKLLVEVGGADIHAEDDDAFRLACFYGCLDVVKYLDSKSNYHHYHHYHHPDGVKIDFIIPLRNACCNGHLDVVKYLHSRGADVHSYDRHFISCLIHFQYFCIIDFLADNGNEYAKKSRYKRV
jgi:ankyrin repeat protein